MRKIQFKEVIARKVDDIICDMCGASCVGSCCGNPINATLEICGNYDYQDRTHIKCDLCPSCFEKVCEFIKSNGGNIRKCHWDLSEFSGCQFCEEDKIEIDHPVRTGQEDNTNNNTEDSKEIKLIFPKDVDSLSMPDKIIKISKKNNTEFINDGEF